MAKIIAGWTGPPVRLTTVMTDKSVCPPVHVDFRQFPS
ncbi:MAG: hypothetical protein ACI9QL_005268, partial [Candidatus Omnitrophota bacterium]